MIGTLEQVVESLKKEAQSKDPETALFSRMMLKIIPSVQQTWDEELASGTEVGALNLIMPNICSSLLFHKMPIASSSKERSELAIILLSNFFNFSEQRAESYINCVPDLKERH